MEKIGSYYQSSFYDKTAKAGKDSGTARTTETKTERAGKDKSTPTLSKAAQKLLKELQKTYKNMDFIVADYETDEEAAEYLSRGTGEYSALLSTDELEKMAADENVRKKNMEILDGAVEKLEEMKTQLGDKGEDVTRIGISIGKDGEVSFFAELEKNSEKQRERIERQREEKRTEAKEAKKAEQETGTEKYMQNGRPGKRTTVYASSVSELAEKISQVDWDAVKEEHYNPFGQHFNYTV